MKSYQQTLASQLQIDQVAINRRKELFELEEEEGAVLTGLKSYIQAHLDEIVDMFYERQLNNAEVVRLIGDAETFRRLSESMRRYIYELFEGYYDEEYVNKRLRIGMVHHRLNVGPELYMAAISILESILCEKIDEVSVQNSRLENAESAKNILRKLLKFDVSLVFDTYVFSLVKEVNAAKDQLNKTVENLEKKIEERTESLKETSRRDELTGLFNRRAMEENLRRELSRANRKMEVLSVVCIDLNEFKKLNDSEGHLIGDEVLKRFGNLILEIIRDQDVGCRQGGDEFCIIFPNSSVADSRIVIERLVEKSQGIEKEFGVTFSAGIAETGPDNHLLDNELIELADSRMYMSKEKSREQAGFYITSEEGQGDPKLKAVGH